MVHDDLPNPEQGDERFETYLEAHGPLSSPVRPVSYAHAVQAVVYIEWFTSDRIQPYTGTGILIARHLVMTCMHVFKKDEVYDDINVYEATFIFNHQSETRDSKRTYIAKRPCKIWRSSTGKDWLVVELAAPPEELDMPIALCTTPPNVNDQVRLIHHPYGEEKKDTSRLEIKSMYDEKIEYKYEKSPGSSGAPVCNEQWEMVAMHYSSTNVKRGGIIEEEYWASTGLLWQTIWDDMPDELRTRLQESRVVEELPIGPISKVGDTQEQSALSNNEGQKIPPRDNPDLPLNRRRYFNGWVALALVLVAVLWYARLVNSRTTYPLTPCTYFCGTPTVTDPLEKGKNVMNWQPYDDGDLTCSLRSDGYHLLVRSIAAGVTCPENNKIFGDFQARFTMQFLQGVAQGASSSQGHFLFRKDANRQGYNYIISFSANGAYDIDVAHGSTTQLGSGTALSFNPGIGSTNVIGIVAKESTLIVFVNGKAIWHSTDSTFSNGILAFDVADVYGSSSGTVAEVVFSHLQVWQ